MWFKFPKGAERISVEQQEYGIEAQDEDGNAYFRAPDHFAPRILAIVGFAIADAIPAGAPADLPKADPLRDGAIVELTKSNEALKLEVRQLREDFIVSRSRISSLEKEKNDLAAKLHAAQVSLSNLQDEIEDGDLLAKTKVIPMAKAR